MVKIQIKSINFLTARKFTFIFLLSFIVQLTYLGLNPLSKPRGDAVIYDTVGFNIASGKGFSIDGVNPTTLYPVYPIVLSIIYIIFGHNYFIVQLFLTLFLALTCGFIYLLGKAVFNEKMGLIAAIFISLYPPFFCLSRIMYAEPLFIGLLYTLILLLIFFIKINKPLIIFISGILLGAAILTKPQVIFLPVVITIFLLWLLGFKRALRYLLIFGIGILLCMGPWMMRNYIVFGDFRPIAVLAIKDGKLIKVDKGVGYNKEKAISILELYQQDALKNYYVKAKVEPHIEFKKTFLQKIVNYFGSDYAGNPSNIFDLVRKMYITSYGDVLDMGMPFKSFAQDKNLSEYYWHILVVKTALILVSLFIFLSGVLNMLLSIKRSKETMFLATLFMSYTLFFYLWVIFFGQVGICGRYGIPVLPILILFAVDWSYKRAQ
jgi:4-amino-4-deoxy-L-arabinose transferase-like glycosyltransferase